MASILRLARVTLFGSPNSSSNNKKDKTNKKQLPFLPSRDIPALTNRVILITGGAGDLGRQTAIELARHGRPSRIYLADLPDADSSSSSSPSGEKRSEAAISAVVNALPPDAQQVVKISYLPLDLSSLESVKDAAKRFLEMETRLDILVLNAGIMPVKSGLSKDGYEVVFGVNYLGHALFTRLLLPVLVGSLGLDLDLEWVEEEGVEEVKESQGKGTATEGEAEVEGEGVVGTGEGAGEGEEGKIGKETEKKKNKKVADVRIVVVASEGHAMAPKGGIVFDKLKTECEKMGYFARYGQSKVALIGLAKYLALEYPQLTISAVHPGRISTGLATVLQRDSFLVRATAPLGRFVTTTVELGARNHVWAAVSPNVVSGQYYVPVGVLDKKTVIEKDPTLATRLKEWTDKELQGWM